MDTHPVEVDEAPSPTTLPSDDDAEDNATSESRSLASQPEEEGLSADASRAMDDENLAARHTSGMYDNARASSSSYEYKYAHDVSTSSSLNDDPYADKATASLESPSPSTATPEVLSITARLYGARGERFGAEALREDKLRAVASRRAEHASHRRRLAARRDTKATTSAMREYVAREARARLGRELDPSVVGEPGESGGWWCLVLGWWCNGFLVNFSFTSRNGKDVQ